jgi:hypothetical protein
MMCHSHPNDRRAGDRVESFGTLVNVGSSRDFSNRPNPAKRRTAAQRRYLQALKTVSQIAALERPKRAVILQES